MQFKAAHSSAASYGTVRQPRMIRRELARAAQRICEEIRRFDRRRAVFSALETLSRTYPRAAHDDGYQVTHISSFEGVPVQRIFPALVSAYTGFCNSATDSRRFCDPPFC
jgi:hypothetical protein